MNRIGVPLNPPVGPAAGPVWYTSKLSPATVKPMPSVLLAAGIIGVSLVTPLGTVTNETPIIPAANSTDGMGFTVAGDNLLVYQTGPAAGPTGGFNGTPIRFITALLANNNGTTTYTTWDPT